MAKVVDSVFHDVRFEECRLLGVDFGRASRKLPLRLEFVRCDLSYASFAETPVKDLRIEDSTVRDADFTKAAIAGAVLSGADLAGAVFRAADLRKADLRTARGYTIDPKETRLEGAKFSLPEALSLLAAFGVELE